MSQVARSQRSDASEECMENSVKTAYFRTVIPFTIDNVVPAPDRVVAVNVTRIANRSFRRGLSWEKRQRAQVNPVGEKFPSLRGRHGTIYTIDRIPNRERSYEVHVQGQFPQAVRDNSEIQGFRQKAKRSIVSSLLILGMNSGTKRQVLRRLHRNKWSAL